MMDRRGQGRTEQQRAGGGLAFWRDKSVDLAFPSRCPERRPMNPREKIPSIPPSVVPQIAQLPDLSLDALCALWRQCFGREAAPRQHPYLERHIAWKLQEMAFRQENPVLLEQNPQRIEALIGHARWCGDRGGNGPVPGTVLLREYQGVAYRVTVTCDGQFEYRGVVYRSLLRIAREIMGVQWSDPGTSVAGPAGIGGGRLAPGDRRSGRRGQSLREPDDPS